MKKKLFTLLCIIALSFSLFASQEIQTRLTNDNFIAYDLNHYALGGATLNKAKGPNGFMSNPAALADKGFFLELPINLSLNHASGILQSNALKNAPAIFGSQNPEEMADAIMEVMRNLSGRAPFVDSVQSLSIGFYGFGIHLSARERILTKGESISSDIILAVDTRLSIGYGYRFEFSPDYALSIGLTLNGRYKTYSDGIGVEAAVNAITGAESASEWTRFKGFSISGDVGLLAELPYGFSLGLVGRNIGGIYHMDTVNPQNGGYASHFTMKTPFQLDLGVSYSFSWSLLNLNLEADFVNLNTLIMHPSYENLLKTINLGASLGLWQNIIFKTGLNQGYPSFGIELNILCFHIEGAYYLKDAGTIFGLKGDDTLAVEIGLSFD